MKILLSRLNQILSAFTGWLMLIMMGLLTLDILSRLFKTPIQGMAELSVFVMMIVVFLGMARCEELGEHVNLSFVLDRLSPSKKKILHCLRYLLSLLTVLLLFYAVTLDSIASFSNNESIASTIELPVWPTKFLMVIGLLFYFLQTALMTIDAVMKMKNGEAI